MSDEVLKLRGVSVRRETSLLLRNIDWTAHENERWIVIGPNGAGKTTLLQGASTLLFPTEGGGEVLGERLGEVDVFDLRPRIGLTSAAIAEGIVRRVGGSRPHWMWQPPAATPISRMILSDASRMSWYSLSVSVCAGATVMLSPVWIPIGSRFSMEQTITTLSARSRMTSSSYSSHPRIDSSLSTSVVGLAPVPARCGTVRDRYRTAGLPCVLAGCRLRSLQ